MIKRIFYIVLAFLLFISCSNDNVSGGGIDVANGYISGIINTSSNSNGDSLIVKAIPIDFIPTLLDLPDTLIDTTSTTGAFSIGPIDTGIYNIIIRSTNNSHIGFIHNLLLNDSDLYIIDTIDEAYTLSLILQDSLYGTSNNLFIEGTDIKISIPDTIDTLIIVLPKDTLPSLLITDNGTIGKDTIINELPLIDSLIDFSEANYQYDTTGTFFHWSNIGVPTDTATQLLLDSNNNIWAIFNSGLACLIPDSTGSNMNAVYYGKNTFSDSINEITYATISPIGELWVGTNGAGMFRRIINIDGSLIGSGTLKDNIYFYMISDSISTIDFLDSTILVGSPGGFSYGNYYLNNTSTILESAPGEVLTSAFFFASKDIFYIVDSTLEVYNLNDSTVNTTPMGYSLGSDKIIRTNSVNSNLVYLSYLPPSTGRKTSIFDNQKSELREYSIPVLDQNIFVTSSAIDKNNNEWFGLSNGTIIRINNEDENNYRIYNSQNSELSNEAEYINSIKVTQDNKLIATFGIKGFFLLNLNPI